MPTLVRVMCSPFVQLLGAVALFATLALGVMHVQQRPQPIVVVVPPAPVVVTSAATPTTVVAPVAYPYCYYGWYWNARTRAWPYCRD